MIDWSTIDTVLLDMDGTLLDLNFDNQFWLRHVPACYAAKNGISFDDACKSIFPQMNSIRGTLEWYCIDHWSRKLDLKIAELKADLSHLIQPRPGTEDFLRWLKHQGKTTWLATNAHEDTITIKFNQFDLTPWLDHVVSSHQYNAPKEDPRFWQQLFRHGNLDPERCLFIDDNAEVLRTAVDCGVGFVLTISQPDMSVAPRTTTEFASLDHFSQIMHSPT